MRWHDLLFSEVEAESAVVVLAELAGVGIHIGKRRGVGLHGNPLHQVGGGLHDVLIIGNSRNAQGKLAADRGGVGCEHFGDRGRLVRVSHGNGVGNFIGENALLIQGVIS